MFNVPLFPPSGLDQSALTPVLLGVLVSWLFTEWLGWVFAGLVVPGYLACVFMLHPTSGVIDVAEALLTYAAARALGEHLPKTGISSRVFGRERFLLIVLVSIVVRVAVEAVLLPRVAPGASWAFSIGLVVVPLAANACWKTGLARGAFQLAVPTLIVWALLRYVLIPYTNFSIHAFALATENVAATFVATPRAYIVLVTGAILASVANVRWGWDFNGILVPALLALIVLEPQRLAITMGEAVVVYALGVLALRRIRAEGPRKTVLFFGIDYTLRFAAAHLLGRTLPGLEVAGAMGFGYLVPTLLAVKMAQRGSISLVALPALEVAGGALLLGSLVGTAFEWLDPRSAPARDAIEAPAPKLPDDPIAAAAWLVARDAEARELRGDADVSARRVAWLSALRDGRSGDASRQRLAGGTFVVFEVPGENASLRGAPSTFVAAEGDSPKARPKLAVVCSGDAALCALAAGLVGEGGADAAVVASAGADSEALARSFARTLVGEDGTLVTLARGRELACRMAEADGVMVDRVVRRLVDLAGGTKPTTLIRSARGGAIEVPAEVLARALGGAPESSPTDEVALALALDDVRADGTRNPSSIETLALARLVLAPLVSSSPPEADTLALAGRVARASGMGVTRRVLPTGDVSYVVSPELAGLPLVMVARPGGTSRPLLVESDALTDASRRDVAVLTAHALSARGLVLTARGAPLETGGALLQPVRAALGNDRDGRAPGASSASPKLRGIIALDRSRRARDEGPSAAGGAFGRTASGRVATWGERGDEVANDVRDVLAAAGLDVHAAPLSLSRRSFALRSVPPTVALVVVDADADAYARASLANLRDARRTMAFAGVPVSGAPCAVAAQLAGELRTEAPTFDAATTLARRVARERSATARTRLAEAIAATQARAALVHARGEGTSEDFLVVAYRGADGLQAVAEPTSLRAPHPSIACTWGDR